MEKKLENKKWILGVSGGADSMALLDLCLKENINVVVAHVNYKKRKSADRDEKGVRSFCQRKGVPIEVLYPIKEESGNFQGWARKVRYQFFKECVNKYQATGVLIAHHQDDLLETYFLQKKRGSTPEVYGLRGVGLVEDTLIQRPLLEWTKKNCEDYCKKQEVPFFVDESNLSDSYERNKIRHHQVEKMSKKEREKVLNTIQLENKVLSEERSLLKKRFVGEKIDLSNLNEEENQICYKVLRLWLQANKQKEAGGSNRYFEDLWKTLKTSRNIKVPLKKGWIMKHNTICEIVGNQDKSYSFVLKSYQSLKTSIFSLQSEGPRLSAVTVFEEDWPLTIRNVQPGDKIKLRIGHKKIHRWFIDRKIPLAERETWPVVENCYKEIILVPGIGCDVKHYSIKPNVFVVKY